MMVEMKGKLETTYEWTCEFCERDNRVVDSTQCANCGRMAKNYLRHFKLTPEPMRLGWRVP